MALLATSARRLAARPQVVARCFSSDSRPFDKVMVANRGEIACRVMKTARQMGIATVAVYSDADAGSKHVEMADEAVHVGGAASADSYLQGQRIIDAALATGAKAIHSLCTCVSRQNALIMHSFFTHT